MIETLNDFINEFKKVKEQGWIKTHRSGSTGVGKTLEDILGISENNNQEPDFGVYELKSSRIESNSMLTIITKAPQPSKSNEYLRNKYGYISEKYKNNKKVLHATLTATRFVGIHNTNYELKVCYNQEKVYLISNVNTEIDKCYWTRDCLKKAFNNKIKNKIVYVKAKTNGQAGNKEEFLYEKAWLLYGFNYNSFIKLLEEGKIFLDLRIGEYPNGKIHDHGTGFRIRESDQDLLFLNKELLL